MGNPFFIYIEKGKKYEVHIGPSSTGPTDFSAQRSIKEKEKQKETSVSAYK